MTEHSLWRFSRALYRAINERQCEDLEALIDDDVEWAIHGPIDMFPFLGARHGKAAVLEVIRQIAENVRVHRFDRGSIMLGVDSAASMMRYSLTALDSNKPISLRARPFRAIQGRPAGPHPRTRRYLRPGGAGARASNPSAEARVIVIV
jgi:ketosteroid isomerase-like protein